MNFPTYGSIRQYYNVKNILDEEVVITEKLHGTNVRFMWSPEHGLVLGGRRAVLFQDGVRNTDFDGFNFSGYINSLPDTFLEKLQNYPNHVFYGEFHGGNIQKGVKYTNERQKDLRIFDVRGPDGNFLPWGIVLGTSIDLGVKTVPVVGIGKYTEEQLHALIDVSSETAKANGVEVGEDIAEGVVIKAISPRLDHHEEWLRCKLKSQKWAENAARPKRERTAKSPEQIELQKEADEFAASVVTEGRVATIVEHITREGNVTIDMRRTPDFMKELSKDIWTEHASVKNELEKDVAKMYSKAVSDLGVRLWKVYVRENATQ